MGEVTAIEWTDHTFNPWIGCAKVKGNPRVRTKPENWRKVRQWAREAERLGTTRKVFCASLADWLDDEVNECWLADLLDEIAETRDALVWQLLTKRPENWAKRLQAVVDLIPGHDEDTPGTELARLWLAGKAPSNVWLGVSAENQQELERRAPRLLACPAAVRFLSCEPLLGPLNIKALAGCKRPLAERTCSCWPGRENGISWVIAGGESGQSPRPMHPDWARSLRDQCRDAGVPFFFRQWGEWVPSLPAIALAEGAKATSENRRDWGTLDAVGHWWPETTPWNGRQLEESHDNAECVMIRVGKRAAGNLLDGRLHEAFPDASATGARR